MKKLLIFLALTLAYLSLASAIESGDDSYYCDEGEILWVQDPGAFSSGRWECVALSEIACVQNGNCNISNLYVINQTVTNLNTSNIVCDTGSVSNGGLIACGTGSVANASGAVSLGPTTRTSGMSAISIGSNLDTPGEDCVNIGNTNTCNSLNGATIGTGNSVSSALVWAYGWGMTNNDPGTILFGMSAEALKIWINRIEVYLPLYGTEGYFQTLNSTVVSSDNVTFLQNLCDSTLDCVSTLDELNGSTLPGGVNTYMQYNDGGTFGGDADFTYDKTSNILTLDGVVQTGDGVNDRVQILRDEIKVLYGDRYSAYNSDNTKYAQCWHDGTDYRCLNTNGGFAEIGSTDTWKFEEQGAGNTVQLKVTPTGGAEWSAQDDRVNFTDSNVSMQIIKGANNQCIDMSGDGIILKSGGC